jgi:hypothetical protein
VITRTELLALRVLARPRTAAARLRRRMLMGASAGMGTSLLILAAFAELGDTVPNPSNYGIREPNGGFAPIVAQPQNRIGTAVAVVLLTIPLIALTVQALHVGEVARDRTRSALSLAGATPQDLRRIGAWENATAFACGGLFAGPAYLVLWLLLGVLPGAGSRLIPGMGWELVFSWLAVAAALTVSGAASGGIGRRKGPAGELGGNRAVPRSYQWLRAVLAVIAACAAIYLPLHVDRLETLMGDFLPFALVAEVVLVMTAAAAALSWCTSRPRPNRFRADQAVELLATAQRKGYPGAAGWLGAVLFVCGLAFYVEIAFLVSVAFDSDTFAADVMFYAGPTFLAMAAVAVAVAAAVAALAIRMADHLTTARRALAATAALGVEPNRLLAVQARVLTATAVPATLVGYLTPVVAAAIVGPSPTLAAAVLTAPLLWVGLAAMCHLIAHLHKPRILAASAVEHLRTP